MKNIIILLLFIIITVFTVSLFINRKINQLNDIDYLHPSLQKVRDIVPKSNDIYYFSNIKDLSRELEVYYKTQFILVPRIITKEKYKDIPNNSYILMIQEKKIDSSYLNINMLFHGTDSLVTYNDEFYIITLLKKK